jgi:hypothetical protein
LAVLLGLDRLRVSEACATNVEDLGLSVVQNSSKRGSYEVNGLREPLTVHALGTTVSSA